MYTWEHSGHVSPCLQMQSNCLHLIPAITQEHYSTYKCVSQEKDYRKVVKTYELKEQLEPQRRNAPYERNDALAVVPQMVWLALGLTAAVLGIFR